MTVLWILLAIVMGACVALQGTFNAQLASRIGTGEALIANTLIVAIGSAAVLVALRGGAGLAPARLLETPWYEYLGGAFGFLIILLAILLFPRLGAGLTLALAITAQLVLAMIIDHFGILGVPVHAVSLPRLAGVALLVAGAALIKLA